MTDKPSLLEFPCEFVIKIFGKTSLEFQGAVLTILKKHIPHLGEGAIKTTPSKQDKYLALSVTFKAESQTQLDEIYRDLSACPLVVMAL